MVVRIIKAVFASAKLTKIQNRIMCTMISLIQFLHNITLLHCQIITLLGVMEKWKENSKRRNGKMLVSLFCLLDVHYNNVAMGQCNHVHPSPLAVFLFSPFPLFSFSLCLLFPSSHLPFYSSSLSFHATNPALRHSIPPALRFGCLR